LAQLPEKQVASPREKFRKREEKKGGPRTPSRRKEEKNALLRRKKKINHGGIAQGKGEKKVVDGTVKNWSGNNEKKEEKEESPSTEKGREKTERNRDHATQSRRKKGT